jgi:methionine-rich copper-binding protein CopC
VNAIARTVVVALIVLFCWASGAGTAVAHTALAGSDPADGATVGTSPTVVTLTFTGDINPTFANVVITTKDGRNWASGAPAVAGPQLRAPVSPEVPAGEVVTVGYRVVSEDGHPVSGSFTFTVAERPGASAVASSAAAAPSTSVAPSEPAAPAGADTKQSIIIAGAGGLLLGAAIAFWQSRRHRRKYLPLDEPPST